jgi:hypothetical protein
MMRHSTSQRSWRQNVAQGGASVASGTLGNVAVFHQARFSGRQILSPAKAGSGIIPAAIPRAALRSTSSRFACPGLNSAAGYVGSLSLVVLSLTIACGGKEPNRNLGVATQSPAATVENYPALVTQAQEVNDAFRRRDFARMIDLTYPKAIEVAGGREKMIELLAKGMKEMEAEGVVVLSSSAAAPTQIVRASGSIYAVVPTTLKAKAQEGVFQTESAMIGISSDNGATWTFIDAGGKDQKELRSILPDIVDKLNLPPEKTPVKISNN